MESKNKKKIAALNDLCRTAMGVAGRVYQTPGICAMSEADQSAIRERVETFDEFGPDNDPHGEHDFGAFEYGGRADLLEDRLLRSAMEYGSEDPSDAGQTTRVLTIMLASES